MFDRLEADLAKAMMSLPASKGFEIGSGFAGTDLTGAEHNDEFYMDGDRVRTRTNRCGGVQGGITNGETVYFRVAFKPTATIMREQETVIVRPARTRRSRAAAATIRACCRAPCRWSRRWPRSCSPITPCATRRPSAPRVLDVDLPPNLDARARAAWQARAVTSLANSRTQTQAGARNPQRV